MPFAAPVLSVSEACDLRTGLEHNGKRLVFTNGCFDLLHAGHIRYLHEARGLGDALLVGLNSDHSVRQLKGPGRPLHTAVDRAALLNTVSAVDGVVVFGEITATSLLGSVRPHIYVKGGDYSLETLNVEERSVLESCGAEIRLLSKVESVSTTVFIATQPGLESVRSSGSPSTLPVTIDSISDIASSYDAVILDQWGVIHDGRNLLNGVAEFFQKMGAGRKPVFIITNSGQPASRNETRLERDFGISRGSYKALYSSFDAVCHRLIQSALFPVYAITPEGGERFFAEVGVPLTHDIEAARSIAISGVPPLPVPLLVAKRAAKRGVPVICSGSDPVRISPEGNPPGIGMLARLFEEEGVKVENLGKPEPALYQCLVRSHPELASRRILAVGDQFDSDIEGANAHGFDGALVLTGAVKCVSLPMLANLPARNIPKWIAAGLT